MYAILVIEHKPVETDMRGEVTENPRTEYSIFIETSEDVAKARAYDLMKQWPGVNVRREVHIIQPKTFH